MISIHVERVPSGQIVTVTGEIDLASSKELHLALERAVDDHQGAVIVDLRGLAFLDVSGLRQLVRIQRRLRARERRLAVVCGPGPVRQVLQLVPEDDALPVHTDLATAWIDAVEG